ncbi:pentapeptide repeat-containing protein [Streptomyces sp. BF23-18]|uniref:pentapeptide repeat-containing protein n=1 Tax=Streptomyces sp. BF23-18 TaxID=3240282 RepID=UPI0034E5CCB8
MTRATLASAYLVGATLTGAGLSWATLTDANLSWATLTGTDLTRANGLDPRQASSAITDETTKMPANFYVSVKTSVAP